MNFLNYITLVSMLLMSFLVLIQTRGATLGAGLGASGEINTARRGSDRTLFYLTIALAILFVGSLMVGLLTKK